MEGWQNFFILTGTAAATLVGLLFVAISIGVYVPEKKARDYTGVFIIPILFIYAGVLLLSCISLIPMQSVPIFPISSGLTGFGILYSTLRVIRNIRVFENNEDTDSVFWIWHITLPIIASILFLAGTIIFFFGLTFWTLAIAFAELVSLIASLRNTWALMFWLTINSGKQR